jgi:ABC-2 type transport system permease protein
MINMIRELKFLLSLWKTNLLAAMEFRVSFISQIIGMMLNDAFYFIFWIIFFDRFQQVGGWELGDMFVVFGVTASAFGLVSYLFGNAFSLGEVIAKGRLDYYLSLPRPVLLHTLCSRSVPNGLGDFFYGILSYIASGQFGWDGLARFILGVILASIVFVSFLVIIQSLAFWMGNSTAFGQLMLNAMVTFALYPLGLFDGPIKFILLTIVPAALMGAIPAGFIIHFNWVNLGQMFFGALGLLSVALLIFHLGLRRYESGSAIQIEV